MIAINAAIAITWILTDSFHCVPVHLAWTGWAMEEQGTCINFIASTFANGGVNIVVDTIMVIMPVYEVLKLNLSLQKKIGVAVMFAAGLVYVFCSPKFRVKSMLTYAHLKINGYWNRSSGCFSPKHPRHKPNLCVPPSPPFPLHASNLLTKNNRPIGAFNPLVSN